MNTIREMAEYVKIINSGQMTIGGEPVHPGKEMQFPVAASPGDCIPQGDLYLTLVEEGYEESGASYKELPPEHSFWETGTMQLVPGNTEGSRHVLQVSDVNSVRIKIPTEWNEETLSGPILHLTNGAAKIVHPKHGDIIFPADASFVINCTYQRNWEWEERAERRARD